MTKPDDSRLLPSPAQAARQAREAAALRENLRRRKQQGRARGESVARDATDAASGTSERPFAE